jgi:hypothetical protein
MLCGYSVRLGYSRPHRSPPRPAGGFANPCFYILSKQREKMHKAFDGKSAIRPGSNFEILAWSMRN